MRASSARLVLLATAVSVVAIGDVAGQTRAGSSTSGATIMSPTEERSYSSTPLTRSYEVMPDGTKREIGAGTKIEPKLDVRPEAPRVIEAPRQTASAPIVTTPPTASPRVAISAPPPVRSVPAPAPSATDNSAQNAARCVNADRKQPADGAIGGCSAVIKESAANLASAYYYRATAHRAKGEYDRALADFSQAITLTPSDAESINGRGTAYEGKNDLDRALADYDAALKLNPKFVDALNNRGAAYQKKGDFSRAAADYGEVVKLQPNNIDAWGARCWSRAVAGRELTQALADCNQALKLKADLPDVLDSRGFVQFKMGQTDQAIADYDAALKLDPKLASALYGRGIAKQKKGDRPGATADLSAARAIRADIGDELSRYGLR